MNMDFGANKTSVEIIKEGAFGGTYFRDICFSVINEWYKESRKEFDELNKFHQKYYFSNYYDVSVNKYGVKCGASLRLVPMVFQILGRRSVDDLRQINRC